MNKKWLLLYIYFIDVLGLSSMDLLQNVKKELQVNGLIWLGPNIKGLVTYIYWKYVVMAELSKLTYVED